MRLQCFNLSQRWLVLLCIVVLLTGAATLPAMAQPVEEPFFPPEPIEDQRPTKSIKDLDFNKDCDRSSCAIRYSDRNPINYVRPENVDEVQPTPFYLDRTVPANVVPCSRFANEPPLRQMGFTRPENPTIMAVYSFNAAVASAPFSVLRNTHAEDASFHAGATGGMSRIELKNVKNYSVCAARGDNEVFVHNTDNGGIHTYGGNNTIHLSGNNRDQLTRAGDGGNNVIEVSHAEPTSRPQVPSFRNEQWKSYGIYRTGMSGGTGVDTVVLKNLPAGSKWCHIGSYNLLGERFHVVEFALSPSVIDGPRRQRINFGTTIEYVEVFGDRMTLQEFLGNKVPFGETCAPTVAPPAPEPISMPAVRGYW